MCAHEQTVSLCSARPYRHLHSIRQHCTLCVRYTSSHLSVFYILFFCRTLWLRHWKKFVMVFLLHLQKESAIGYLASQETGGFTLETCRTCHMYCWPYVLAAGGTCRWVSTSASSSVTCARLQQLMIFTINCMILQLFFWLINCLVYWMSKNCEILTFETLDSVNI